MVTSLVQFQATENKKSHSETFTFDVFFRSVDSPHIRVRVDVLVNVSLFWSREGLLGQSNGGHWWHVFPFDRSGIFKMVRRQSPRSPEVFRGDETEGVNSGIPVERSIFGKESGPLGTRIGVLDSEYTFVVCGTPFTFSSRRDTCVTSRREIRLMSQLD